ncbi:2-dehydro-3-deoxyphosphogluconate aldolase [Flaviflexus salsibiostraticola]|uniref:2-dehydro-3-deoxyphosphogluconate aldolase n=1 Tax=Flaviflexus salsibiostraticola TaxID=1282737 RepID=A0A3Q8WU94_9ACTO|nr:2-dehydro-3-deoxyphosphogluconate aldolase [Flaviflexus salsibiostraticola]AZN30053.1 2-dehydro-3-deoxyphosphogluconate aldolase [Flaviflexus salsibiostraticola]
MIVAIIRLRSMSPPDELMVALREGGVSNVEVTLPTPGSLEFIERWASDTTVTVGAGTVRTGGGARAAGEAGAKFFVTPTTDMDVLEAADEMGIPVYPGALSPTEIESVFRHPAVRAVKVFPAGSVGGPAYIKAIKDPMPDIPLLPTGGVGIDETEIYSRLGCAGVGVGSALVSEPVVLAGDWTTISDRARAFVDAWDAGQSD